MSTLRARVIKLAHQDRDLRPFLLHLLEKTGGLTRPSSIKVIPYPKSVSSNEPRNNLVEAWWDRILAGRPAVVTRIMEELGLSSTSPGRWTNADWVAIKDYYKKHT